MQVREVPAPGSTTERSTTPGVLGPTANLTFRLPTVPDAPTFATPTGVQGEARVQVTPVRTVPDSAQWAFHFEQPGGVRVVLAPDKGWIASGRTATTPDIALAAWRPEWRLRSGTPTTWASRTVFETAAILGGVLTFQEETTVRRGVVVP